VEALNHQYPVLTPLRSAARSGITLGRRVAWYLVQYAVDLRHGMVTRDVVFTKSAQGEWHPHEPAPARQFLSVLRSLPVNPAEYVFIDLGSGKGAALVLAAHHGYVRLIGVEYDGDLIAVARKNTQSLRNRRPDLAATIEHVHQDAADYAWPELPTVVYMNNPFGEKILSTVLARLEKSLQAAPRPLFLIYFNPVPRRLLDASPELLPVRAEPLFCVYRSRYKFDTTT